MPEKQLNFLFKIKNVNLKSMNTNLVDPIWKKKPKIKQKPFFLISENNAVLPIKNKINKVKKFLLKNKIDFSFGNCT